MGNIFGDAIMKDSTIPLWHLALWIIVVSWIICTHIEINRIDRELTYLRDKIHYHEVVLEGLVARK